MQHSSWYIIKYTTCVNSMTNIHMAPHAAQFLVHYQIYQLCERHDKYSHGSLCSTVLGTLSNIPVVWTVWQIFTWLLMQHSSWYIIKYTSCVNGMTNIHIAPYASQFLVHYQIHQLCERYDKYSHSSLCSTVLGTLSNTPVVWAVW
jgi:hypothetical protein